MPTPFRYLALAALVQVTWGITPCASRLVLDSLPVEVYSALRFGFSGIVFLAVAWGTRRKLPTPREALPLAGVGILAFGVASLGTLYGLKIGGVVNLALASSFNAPITALVALVLLKEKRSPKLPWALLASVAGGVLTFLGKHSVSGFQVAFGSLACLWGAYLLESLGLVTSKQVRERFPVVSFLGVAHVSASAFLFGCALVSQRSFESVGRMPAAGWAAFFFVAIVSCCLCYFLLYWLVGHVPAHKLAFFDAFHSVSAAVFGYVFYREPMTPLMLAGGLLLFLAVGLIHSSRLDDLHVTDEFLDEGRAEYEKIRAAGI